MQKASSWLALVCLVGCTKDQISTSDQQKEALGPACSLLQSSATKAAACDSALAELPDKIFEDAGEVECRRVIRRLLSPDPPDDKIHSIYTPHQGDAGWVDGQDPLTDSEKQNFEQLPLPAFVEIVPAQAPAPGVAMTHAQIGERTLAPDQDGHLRHHLPPGRHNIVLQHAGHERGYCLSISSCEQIKLFSHGSELQKSPGIRSGSCSAPVSEIAASQPSTKKEKPAN